MILGHEKKNVLYATLTPTLRGRYEVQKNKWTPQCQTEFDGESEKNDRFVPRELLFLTKYGSYKKWLLSDHIAPRYLNYI